MHDSLRSAPVGSPTAWPPSRSGLVAVAGRQAYAVTDLDQIDPFLIGMVSDGDRWAFVSSNGPIAAGRRNPDAALFPYETDDRLHRNVGIAGPATRLSVPRSPDGERTDWQPFDPDRVGGHRAVLKSVVGDLVSFVDFDSDSRLRFEWTWTTAEEYGFIRTATLTNSASQTQIVDVIDGIVGIMPAGLPAAIFQKVSNLSNAYRRSELVDLDGFPLAVYSLEAPVSDRADPEEMLRANVVWHTGLDGAEVSLDPKALRAFRPDNTPPCGTERLLTGRPGAYLLRSTVELQPGESISWQIVADVALSQADIVDLQAGLNEATDVPALLVEAARANHDHLKRLTAIADAQQLGSDGIVTAHHSSNVTYNILRGGVPMRGYQIDTSDFKDFLSVRNRSVLSRHQIWLDALPSSIERRELDAKVRDLEDADLERLFLEYLPFSFSRRHGDPSRPWNRFDIKVRDEAGESVVHFEGNWRDVFQNWEALCVSFPEYLPGLISLFVNASTAEGYNAYRIGRDGIDWEVPDPDDPWANIGYWGDHQVVYLLRLLRQCDRLMPGALDRYLVKPIFTYADVPYRLADYDQMVRNPRATVDYDQVRAASIDQRVRDVGADGKLLPSARGELVRVTLIEKLLVTALAKVVNFVPDAGIWMNTQRPEWNDANNALVGLGASMVTLFHLRDYLGVVADMVRRAAEVAGSDYVVMSGEIATWFDRVDDSLAAEIRSGVDGRQRRAIMDTLGGIGSDYRAVLRSNGLAGDTRPIPVEKLVAFCGRVQGQCDETINANWRPDGLVHSYNQLSFVGDEVGVNRLPLMLEGQVAALSAAPIDDRRRVELVDALFDSDLYRPDQRTFVLMATDPLPPFLHRNIIPADAAQNPLLTKLLASGDRTLVTRDARGAVRFHPDIVNSAALDACLRELGQRADGTWARQVSQQRDSIGEVFEATFGHNAYLGRSGSMYAYEGIGSVYWHMVTKLLLAVQEVALAAAKRTGSDNPDVRRLVAGYKRVRDGLGFRKSPTDFGAIPIDPYSHTPHHTGAQQPGMTGAVKEELLARWAEVGLEVVDGRLTFAALFVDPTELVEQPHTWAVDVGPPGGGAFVTEVDVPARSIASTFCQVPVIVTVSDSVPPTVTTVDVDGSTRTLDGGQLDEDTTQQILARAGRVALVRAVVTP